MPGELGNQEFSQQAWYYDRRYPSTQVEWAEADPEGENDFAPGTYLNNPQLQRVLEKIRKKNEKHIRGR